jgi:hypothetical protein
MAHRGSWFTAVGIVFGLAAGAAALQASAGPRLAYLTFSGPVRLPGVVLQAGTYAFEVAEIAGNSNVVVVRNRARNELIYMGTTQRVERPRTMSTHSEVAFGEVQRGEVTPITVWYPPDGQDGRQFLYRR